MCDPEVLDSKLSESENSLPGNDDDFYIHDDEDVIIDFLDKSNPIVGLFEHL